MYTDSNASTAPLQQVTEFFLARQAILNRSEELVAFELLFRRAGQAMAGVIDDRAATAAVIARAAELGIDNVIGAVPGFVNVDASVLMGDFVQFLPAKKVVLEILETVQCTPELLERIAELSKAGYTFALDDVIEDSANLRQLLPWASILKIDIEAVPAEALPALVQRLHGNGKKLLAEKVETQAQFEACLALGFDYFQGYYFARPVIMSGKTLSPSQSIILQVCTLITSDAEDSEIERGLKQDASLSLGLLRLVSSVGVGGRRIDSLAQAIRLLGRHQLHRWLQILLYAEKSRASGGSNAVSTLLELAAARAKLLELLAQRLHPGKRQLADAGFTVGIMSLIDTLFGTSMDDILSKLAVGDDIAEALLHRHGEYGAMLLLAEFAEKVELITASHIELLEQMDLSMDEFCAMQITAYEWGSQIAHSVQAPAPVLA